MNHKTRYTISTLALLGLTASPGFAQSTEVEELGLAENRQPEAVDTIIVTGTRLSQGDDSVPALTITAEDIQARGITTIDQLLRQIPTNNSAISSSNPGGINGPTPISRGQRVENLAGGSVANLRGIGAGSTLVLVNGRRRAGEASANGDFFDIGGIAIDSIDRVEIVTSGASAIYGSDAVAGVINIILKKDYEGTTVNLRAENSSSGGDMQSAGITHGRQWSTGGLTVTGNYVRNEAVSLRKFGVTSFDQRARGGRDFRQFASENGVFFRDENIFGSADDGDIFGSDAYELSDGFGTVDAFTDIADLNLVSRDVLNEVLPESMSPETELLSFSLNVDQDVNLGILNSVYAEFNYSHRDTDTEVARQAIDINSFDLAFGLFGSPFIVDEVFFDPRTDISFSRSLSREAAAGIIPNDGFDTKNEDFGFALGAKGDFGGGWDWDLSGSYSLNKDRSKERSLDLFSLYNGVFDFDTFEIVTEPFNLARADFLTNPEAQAALQSAVSVSERESETSVKMLQGVIRKDFLEGREIGAISTAFGAEYRSEDVSKIRNQQSELSSFVDDVDTDSKRETLALFGEVSFPLSANFTVNGAARYEDVKNTGNTTTVESSVATFIETGGFDQFDLLPFEPYNFSDSGFSPRIGVAWEPRDILTLRGTIGRSFRAPNADEIAAPAQSFESFGFVNPDTGGSFDFLVPTVAGGNPNLKSEVADTYNFGFTFTPKVFDIDWNLTVDRWAINYEDRIVQADLFRGTLFTDPPVPTDEVVIVRGADGAPRYLIESVVNSAREELAGYDISLDASRSFGEFDVYSNFKLALQTKREVQAISSEPFIDTLGQNQPKTSWNWNTEISRGPLTFGGTLRHTGSFDQAFGTGLVVTQVNEVDSFTTADLQASYVFDENSSWASNTTLRVGVTNVFDEDPPFLNTAFGASLSFYDIRRRVISVGLSKTF